MMEPAPLDRQSLHAELDHAADDFRQLLTGATPQDLRRASDGTRWNNEQLLFHMLFGFLIVRALLPLVGFVSRMPRAAQRGFIKPLNVAQRPFDTVNYWGAVIGAKVFNHKRMGRRLDRVIALLHRHLDADSPAVLRRTMPYPTSWDPFFTTQMSRTDLYHYAYQHYEFHRRQLTLATDTEP